MKRHHESPATCPISISSVACKEGYAKVYYHVRNNSGVLEKQKFQLFYRVFRPNSLKMGRPPIICIHGGLGLPSDYLLPIVDSIPYRTIIMYDQLGCGRSSVAPSTLDSFSIQNSVEDFKSLLKTLNIEEFHLYAHSAGACIAYEYLKDMCSRSLAESDSTDKTVTKNKCKCLSVVFSSSSFHIQLAKDLADNLEHQVTQEIMSTSSNITASQVAEKIRTSYICRTPRIPFQLKAAYAKTGLIWKGLDVIKDYVAESMLEGYEYLPPLLLLRGEYDFISEELVFQGWANVFCGKDIECVSMKDCSHMPFLEDPTTHGSIINEFYSRHDGESLDDKI